MGNCFRWFFGWKKAPSYQNDRKNFVLFYHLQFQDKFMERQGSEDREVVGCGEGSGAAVEAASNREDRPSSTPIIGGEELPKEDSSGSLPSAPPNASPELPSCSLSQLLSHSKLVFAATKNQPPRTSSQKQINLPTNPFPHPSKNPPFSSPKPSVDVFQNAPVRNNGKFGNKKRKSQRSYYYDEQEDSDAVESFKFPFVNEYLREHHEEYLSTLIATDRAREAVGKASSDSFVNCDVRYFNWKLFTQEVGKFDVMIIDPPWRIKGAQQNDSQFMFSNCKFSLEYNTMANSEIGRIPLHLISDEGFIFVWILNSQLDASVEIMEGWGYELVQEIVWVKLKDDKINLTHGYYFMHSYQVCLVGYKCKRGVSREGRMKVRQGFSWNTIFAEVREKSQKPEDLYALIDVMFKGGKKIEIFARNHNLRFGLFSMGNELGESYDKWLLKLECDKCKNPLKYGEKRYKSKMTPNFDLCPKCIGSKDKTAFFELANDVDENVRHEYVACNHCGTEPIWGLRFQCNTCHDFDICENCYDKNLHAEHNFHPLDHEYVFLEVPVFGNGFHIHESKCSSCYQNPIIGIYFTCSTCKNFKLCQKCYFERPPGSYFNSNKRHKASHQLEVIFEPQVQVDKRYECFGCKVEIVDNCWMCENCYNFFFCAHCYEKRTDFRSLFANTHKNYHVLSKIF